MQVRAAVVFSVFVWALVAPAIACIGPADIVEMAKSDAKLWKQDIEIQRTLVLSLARDTDTIVIGEALNDWMSGNMVKFKIDRPLKGRVVVGSIETYRRSVSVATTPCTPASALFRNTLTSPGERYLLYVKGRALLRAMPLHRTSSEIPLVDELDLIERASSPSLERSPQP